MSSIKVLKKGEYLFKEGDKIQVVYIVQSGQLALCLIKNKKNIDLVNIGPGYVFADWAVLGLQQYSYSCMATHETKVMEIPLESFMQQHEALHPVYKSFVKSVSDKLKWALNEVKNIRVEKNAVPCSDDSVPKVFGILYHTAHHKGLKEGTKVKVDWLTLRQYSQRIFGESIKRIEQATQILVKLKLAEYVYGPNPIHPDMEEEIQALTIYDLSPLEAFFEFYQYYYYRGGKTELLKFDESNYHLLKVILMCFENEVPDRFGVVTKEFNIVVDFCKDYGINLNNGHFVALESKGLFCKRKTSAENKVLLQFEIKEFRTQIEIWRVLREIDKWNEKGFIDMSEKEPVLQKKILLVDSIECSSCHELMPLQSKFCSSCGAKLASSAEASSQRDLGHGSKNTDADSVSDLHSSDVADNLKKASDRKVA